MYFICSHRTGGLVGIVQDITAALKADKCIKCGHCSSRCPFHVDQTARMDEINAYFG